MTKILNIIILFFMLFSLSLNANTKEYEKLKNSEIIVGFYGRPNSSSLGILGQSNIDDLVLKMKEKQKYYKKELETYNIKLAFHIIHSLATKDAGRRDDYLLGMSEKNVLKYIKKAQEENFFVFLDVQLGVKTPFEAIKPLLKYLKYDNVHFAIDPEFKIPTHRRYPPGKYVGHIFAKDLNKAQELISNYLKQNNINKKKKLIVHMFHPRMLRKKEEVKNYDNVELIYNIDGHGTPAVKIKIYNSLYTKEASHLAKSGFKIFYNNDEKIMTPKQILGKQKIQGRQIWTQPYYINYQ